MTEANFVVTSPIEKKIILEYRKKLKDGKQLRCQNKKCKHCWIYSGKKKDGYTSCPMCFHPVHVIKHEVIEG